MKFFKANRINYKEIMVRYGTDIKHLAYSYVKDRHLAEDITQETFLRCFTKGNTFKGESTLKTWLYRIAINICKDHLKTAYRNRVIVDNTLAHSENHASPSAEHIVMQLDRKDNVTNYILALPIAYREVIILYYFKDCKIGEIAAILDIPEGTVKTRMRKSRELLKGGMSENE